jgi:hypothetical protein
LPFPLAFSTGLGVLVGLEVVLDVDGLGGAV